MGRFKKTLKYVSLFICLNLIYLNVVVPIAISAEQILLILITLIKTCEERKINVSDLSPKQLDDLSRLILSTVKQIFNERGFRFLPEDIILPACATSGKELIPLSKRVLGRKRDPVNGYLEPIQAILGGNIFINNALEIVRTMPKIALNFFRGLSTSAKVYVLSRSALLGLNITGLSFHIVRYSIWAVSTIVHLRSFNGPFYMKLPGILTSLIRDCHLEIFDGVLPSAINRVLPLFDPLVNRILPLFDPVIKVYRKLNIFQPVGGFLSIIIAHLENGRDDLLKGKFFSIKSPIIKRVYIFLESTFRVKLLWFFSFYGLQFRHMKAESGELLKFGLKVYESEMEEYRKGLNDFSTELLPQKFPTSNLPIIRRLTHRAAIAFALTEKNITEIAIRSSVWRKECKLIIDHLNQLSTPERRRFEDLVNQKWLRGEHLSSSQKIVSILKALINNFFNS